MDVALHDGPRTAGEHHLDRPGGGGARIGGGNDREVRNVGL